MKKLQWIFGAAASLAVVVILLITSFQAAMYLDFDVYRKEYEKYEVLDDLDMEMDDVMYVTHEMMAYLKGDRPRLSVVTTVEGVEQDFLMSRTGFIWARCRGCFRRPCAAQAGGRGVGGISFDPAGAESGSQKNPCRKLSGNSGNLRSADRVSGNRHFQKF